ncbi:hypothetical protein ACHAXR_006279 [Thalassiosira sp. AJA248-18]
MPPPPLPTSKFVLRSLYRSLLRVAAPFSPPSPSAAAYASLLHRSGASHDWEECVHKLERRRAATALRESRNNAEQKKEKENKIPKSWAKNLSRSYTDLQEEYESRKEYFKQKYGVDDDEDFWDDDEASMDLSVGSSSYTITEHYTIEEDPKFVLFRHLLREWFTSGGGDTADNNEEKSKKQWPRQWSPNEEGYYENGKIKQVPLMRFPSQILNDGGLSIGDLIKREFRAPTVEERKRMESKCNEEASADGSPIPKDVYPPSSFVDDEIRIRTAFYTLLELNRKLAWAEKIGFPASSQQATHQTRNWKRLVQAAKGVSQFPSIETKALSKEPPTPDNSTGNEIEFDDDSNAASSSPLQCGTYLIAHPLMTGYFAKSVIVLLDHTEELDKKKAIDSKDNEEGGSGGTYGLIINRLALQPEMAESSRKKQWDVLLRNWEEKKSQLEKEEHISGNADEPTNPQTDSLEEPMSETASSPGTTHSTSIKGTSHNILRPITLLQAINADDLPDTVQETFGGAPVREGGPVNLSLQMIHRKTLETKDDDNDPDTVGGKKTEGSVSKIGGTLLGVDDDKPKDSEDSIFFGGDIIQASYAVLDGNSDGDDFSFIIGASCWAPGQLVNEIERGCWLPFRGPPQMAMTGMVDHNDIAVPKQENEDDTESEKGTKLSPFPPRPSNAAISSVAGSAAKATAQQSGQPVARPVGDLWLSIMCALGNGEADLAYMMLDNKNVTDKFGDACDNFHR